jgi:hypothetical protein
MESPLYVSPFIGLGVVLKSPTADGADNQVIKTDGSGNLSFVTIASGITIDSTAITSGAATRILYENASNQVTSSTNFSIDTNFNVAIGAGTLAISGMGSAEVGLSVELASAASADAFNLTSNGGTAGDLFKVDEIGRVFGINGTAAAPTYSFGSVATGLGMYRRSASGIGFSVASVRRLQITGSDIVNEVLGKFQAGIYVAAGDITVINGEITVDEITSSNNAEGGTAKLTRKNVRETHTLAAAGTSDTSAISIPSGARLLGVSFCVNTAVTNGGDDTWSAAFITGSTTSLATAAAAAQNTKVDTMIVDEITSATTQIRFTAQAGSFTAGVIEIVAYYEQLTALANA